MAEVQTVRQALPEFLEAPAKTYLADLETAIGGIKGLDMSKLYGQQFVAGPGALTTQAESLATGLGGYQPYLQAAQAATGPTAYQAYMSPYQQDVINATLAEYDIQAQKGLPGLAANAISVGAFGGGREGVQRAEYQAASDRNRAALQAQLLQQGFGQAQQAAAQAQQQQMGLASLQPSLAQANIQSLGQAGTGNLAYQQAVLDAAAQGAQMSAYEPYNRLQFLGSAIGGMLSGQPQAYMTSTTPSSAGTASPLSSALSSAFGVYGLGSLFGR